MYKTFGLFLKALTGGASENLLGEFYEDGVAQKAALATQPGNVGGYVVPQGFADRLLMGGEAAVIRPRAQPFPSAQRELLVPLVDTTTAQAAGTSPFYGGLKLTWFTENVQPPETEPAARQLSFLLNYLGGFVIVSNTWLADTPPATAEAFLYTLFAKALAWYEEYAFLRGNGEGQPLGILNAPCTLTVTRQQANQISYADASTMLAKLLPESINRSFFLFNPTCQPQLLQLKDGSNRAAFFSAGANNGWPQWTLAGLPAFPCEKLPALGTAGDLMLIDPTYYCVADYVSQKDQVNGLGRSVIIAFSNQASFTTFARAQSVFMIAQRVDGQPWLDNPVTLQDGVTQASPFVSLK